MRSAWRRVSARPPVHAATTSMPYVLAGFWPGCTLVASWLHRAFMAGRPGLRQPEGMNEHRSVTLVLTNGSAPGDASRGLVLGGEACEQAGYCCLGGGQV